MKPILLMLMFALASSLALAETVKSKIDSLDIGSKEGEAHLLKMETGRVAFLEYGDKNTLKQLQDALKNHQWIEASIGKNSSLESFRVIAPERSETIPSHIEPEDPTDPYVPSVVTLSKAKSIFLKMRKDYKNKSQCFNRAHIWTYEEFTRNQTNLNKVFLFFTSRYIRTYHFGWWFHVTPMTYVGGSKKANWRMLDRRYTSGPLQSKTWTDIFIKSKKTCKVVNKYSSYRDNQQNQDCYMIPVSMYFLVPSDLAALEESGVERTAFEDVEVEYALWEAFGIE